MRISSGNRLIKLIVTATASLVLICFPAYGCITIPDLVFSWTFSPDLPLRKFAQGKLGIIQPTYARSYLCVAYRYLTNRPLTHTEQVGALSVWETRLKNKDYDEHTGWVKAWLDARRKVLGHNKSPNIYVMHPVSDNEPYQMYCNCSKEAFARAAHTITLLSTTYGAHNPLVIDWIKAQDDVFKNCSGQPVPGKPGKMAPVIPRKLIPSAHTEFLHHRTYQIATAHFYAQEFDVARSAFEKIAADSHSPYRHVAKLLAIRSSIRKATLSTTQDNNLLQEAKRLLRSMLANKDMDAYKGNIEGLLAFIEAKVNPSSQLNKLSQRIAENDASDNFKQDVWDFTVLYDNLSACNPYLPNTLPVRNNLPPIFKETDLLDWISVYQDSTADSKSYSVNKWTDTHKPQWLVAALNKVTAQDPDATMLIDAAKNVLPSAPEYLTVNNDLIRILLQLNREEEARKLLDRLITMPDIPMGSKNILRLKRFSIAHNLNDFLKDLICHPVDDSYVYSQVSKDFDQAEKSSSYARRAPAFTLTGLKVLNEQMPLELLATLSLNTAIPLPLRQHLAMSTWVRAVVLDQTAIANKVALPLRALCPQTAPYLNRYLSATTAEGKRFAAAFLMMKNSRTQPYIVNRTDDTNWWWSQGRPTFGDDQLSNKPMVLWLTHAQQKVAQLEQKKLAALLGAPDYLAPLVINYAKAHPSDTRVPEALYLAVRCTRYGARSTDTTDYSKEAFQLLHKKHPQTPWAAKTKYWY